MRVAAWSSPLLGASAGTMAVAHPIESLASRLRTAARASRGPRGLAWLDSGGPASGPASETVLTAFPAEVRRWEGSSPLGPFLDGLVEPTDMAAPAGGCRYRGGWIGFLSYEAVEALEPVRLEARRDLAVPLSSWARHPVWFRHHAAEARLELWCAGDTPPSIPPLDAWRHWAEEALRAPHDRTTPMATVPQELRVRAPARRDVAERWVEGAPRSLDRASFKRAVRLIQRAIAEGDTFQANLAQRITLPDVVDPFAVYIQVRRLNPSPFGCFIEEDWGAIASNSPERLFTVRNEDGRRTLHARPIAGTRPRSGEPMQDGLWRAELAASEKERAEHTMLVDLARNDVGRVAVAGSVAVDAFQTVQEYSHVHHLVSNVRGDLRSDVPFSEVVRAMFPGGTITGAPKLRSVEVIDAVEPVARGPYTGSAGYLNTDGTADLNILIRTLIQEGARAHVYAGAGIVADSLPEREYEETLHKAAALLVAWATVAGHPGEADGSRDRVETLAGLSR